MVFEALKKLMSLKKLGVDVRRAQACACGIGSGPGACPVAFPTRAVEDRCAVERREDEAPGPRGGRIERRERERSRDF